MDEETPEVIKRRQRLVLEAMQEHEADYQNALRYLAHKLAHAQIECEKLRKQTDQKEPALC